MHEVQTYTRLELTPYTSLIVDSVLDSVIDLFEAKMRMQSTAVEEPSVLLHHVAQTRGPMPYDDKSKTDDLITSPQQIVSESRSSASKCRVEGPAEEAIMREALELARSQMQQQTRFTMGQLGPDNCSTYTSATNQNSEDHNDSREGSPSPASKGPFKESYEIKVSRKTRRSDLALGTCLLLGRPTEEFWSYFTDSTGVPRTPREHPPTPSPLRRMWRAYGDKLGHETPNTHPYRGNR